VRRVPSKRPRFYSGSVPTSETGDGQTCDSSHFAKLGLRGLALVEEPHWMQIDSITRTPSSSRTGRCAKRSVQCPCLPKLIPLAVSIPSAGAKMCRTEFPNHWKLGRSTHAVPIVF
jgi:hypothetical protein